MTNAIRLVNNKIVVRGGQICLNNPCCGACCASDGTCTFVTEAACTAAGGTWKGLGTTCSPNPCGVTPTVQCENCFGSGNNAPAKWKVIISRVTDGSCYPSGTSANCGNLNGTFYLTAPNPYACYWHYYFPSPYTVCSGICPMSLTALFLQISVSGSQTILYVTPQYSTAVDCGLRADGRWQHMWSGSSSVPCLTISDLTLDTWIPNGSLPYYFCTFANATVTVSASN